MRYNSPIPLMAFAALAALICPGHGYAREQESPSPPAHPQLVLQKGQGSMAQSLEFSPDGALLAIGDSAQLNLWDVSKGERLYTLLVSTEPRVAFSLDGHLMATALGGDSVGVRDARTGRLWRVLNVGCSPTTLVFSPDGKTLALGTSGQIVALWNYRTGIPILSFHTHLRESANLGLIAFSPDGTRIACASGDDLTDPVVEVWQAGTRTLQTSILAKGEVHSLLFAPDGKTLVIGCGSWMDTPTIALWDLKAGAFTRSFTGHRFDVLSLAFSRSGNTLSSSDARGIFKLWEFASGTPRRSMGEKDFHIPTRVSPDGRLGAEPDNDGSARVYDLETGKTVHLLRGGGRSFQTAAFSADGKAIVTASQIMAPRSSSQYRQEQSELLKWDAGVGNPVRRAWREGTVQHIATGPGDMVVAASELVQATEGAASASVVWNRGGNTYRVPFGPRCNIDTLAVSPQGDTIAVGCEYRQPGRGGGIWSNRPPNIIPRLELLDARTGQRLRNLVGHSGVVAIAFLPGGRGLVVLGGDETLCLWDISTGKLKRRISLRSKSEIGGLDCGSFSLGGRWAVFQSPSGPVRLVDTQTERIVRSFAVPEQISQIVSLAVSPDGSSVAAGTNDGVILCWDRNHGTQWVRHLGESDLQRVLFSPDGKTLLSLDASGDLCRWRTGHGVLIATSAQLGERGWIAYTPRGDYEGSENVDSWIRWRVRETLATASLYHSLLYHPERVQTALSGRPDPVRYAELRRREMPESPGIDAPPPPHPAAVVHESAATTVLRNAMSTRYALSDPAIAKRATQEIWRQLDAGADINATDELGTTPLMFLAERGDTEGVRALLMRKPDLDRVDAYKRTALLRAAYYDHREIVRLLLDAGADLKDKKGKSLLPLQGNPAALGAALLRMLTSEPGEWNTGLDAGVVLLIMGADINVRDRDGNTPLLALQGADSLLFRLLLESGADVNAANHSGETPLLQAIRGTNAAPVRLLLEHGADANRRDEAGWTPLASAASEGRDEIVDLLLEHGVNPNAATSVADDGRTSLMLAISGGYLRVAQLLLDAGASVAPADHDDHESALTCAVRRQDIAAVRLLLEHGADARIHNKEGVGLLTLLKKDDPHDLFGIAPLLKRAGAVD